ncbi:1011_t:CDS:2 [Cetraspora pellucida]|uniref:1011_t:CDS:1 n=1 Tax=Cetraspora pellucida TaxID=1433469 RepID=A0A9N9GRU1_9GLOM|nr:1011_t:CDS:2 [Cetraspora pellucida]
MSNTNNNTNPSEKIFQLYKMFLYKKKDIIAIQKKLSINNNINQTAVSKSKKSKELVNLYELLLELVRDLISIQMKLDIDINPILETEEELDIVGYTNQKIVEEANKNARVYF